MNHLHRHIAVRVDAWRTDGYGNDEYPAIAEVLEWATETETGNLHFLRHPQLRALETYWYLRLIEQTPHVFDLYRKIYPKQLEKAIWKTCINMTQYNGLSGVMKKNDLSFH